MNAQQFSDEFVKSLDNPKIQEAVRAFQEAERRRLEHQSQVVTEFFKAISPTGPEREGTARKPVRENEASDANIWNSG